MIDPNYRPPEGTKLGKAKALEVVVLPDGSRLLKKTKVRYWIERRGAKEDFFIIHQERAYHLNILEFKRHFKDIIRAGEVRHKITD